MTVYFGFAIADSMFVGNVSATRKVVDIEAVRKMIEVGVVSTLNPTHQSTIDAMRQRFGLNVEIPATAPKASLVEGDKFIVMSVRGLPRREGGKAEYSAEEISSATFEFSVWTVDCPIEDDAQAIINCLEGAKEFSGYVLGIDWSVSDWAWEAMQKLKNGTTKIIKA